MAKPAGLQSKLKDNSKKKYREHDEWMAENLVKELKDYAIHGK